MKDAIDAPRTVRPGDELDVPRLSAYLSANVPGLEGPFAVEQFPKGHSNLTYLVRAKDRELVLRRPPPGAKAIQSGHDMSREFRVLEKLHPVYPLAPKPLAFCEEAASPLGAAFYVMERVRGVILRARPPEGVDLPPALLRRLSDSFVDNLAALHAVDWAAAGLSELGRPQGYVRRQVEGWSQRHQKAKTDELPEVDRLAAWLAANAPPEQGAAIIHNDYKYDNLVLDPADLTRILAVLDWEMATVGDPIADLGTSLAYWIQADDPDELLALNFGLTALPGNASRAELVERYAAKRGAPVEHVVFHYALALFKVAGICQQIYFRYKKGFTTDERFAAFGYAVGVLCRQGLRAIEQRHI